MLSGMFKEDLGFLHLRAIITYSKVSDDELSIFG